MLHQVLQWHHMLTATDRYSGGTVADLEANTLADGAFHAAVHIGWLLVGWGAFNVVEGLVDHHLLRIHHVRDDVATPLPWDLGFLAFGLPLIGLGIVLTRSAPTTQEQVPPGGQRTRTRETPGSGPSPESADEGHPSVPRATTEATSGD